MKDMLRRRFYVYIMSSYERTLYVGVTNSLRHRVHQHKTKAEPGFTATYNVNRLVYFEEYSNAYEAIAREKQLKNWSRRKKIKLIESTNPNWDDWGDEL